jgi:lipopolysaccharide transport system permease protein
MSTIMSKEYKTHQTIVEPRRGWQLIDWQELYQYKDLFYFFVLRDIKILYKQTILGFTWAIIRPLVSMIIFSLVFGKLAKMPSDGIPYPLFSFAALVPWTFFSSTMVDSSNSLIANTNMLTKIYFPRLVIPMTPVLAKLIDFAIAFMILCLMIVWYGFTPTVYIIIIPLLVLLMILTSAGIGMWLSAMSIQFRDIKHAIPFLTQLLMYVAPVVWPASLIPSQFRLLYGLYPMAAVIEGFRSTLLGATPMPWDLILIGTLSAIVIAITGAFYFRRTERIFADLA